MEGSDSIMRILKSIKPIKYTYSQRQKALNKSFKNRSLQNLLKHLDYHHKFVDEFSPSPEFLKNENKYDINFRNSNAYIKELSDLNKLPLIANYKNFEKKKNEEEEKNKQDQLKDRYNKSKIFKKKNSNNGLLIYNPNYDYIKKKVFSVHIRPPPSLIRIKKKIKENEKYISKKNKNLSTDKNQDENSNINEYIFEKGQNKSKSVIALNKNKKQNNNNSIIFNTNNKNNHNNSMLFNESYSNRSNSNRSNSSKNQNNCKVNKINSTRNNSALKGKLSNLKILSKKNYEKKNSLSYSNCYTMEANRSTNIENLSHIYNDKEKNFGENSMRNISNMHLKFPKKNKHSISSEKKFNGNIRLRYSISFKKMLGREDNKSEEKNVVLYSPNYDFFRPHIHSTIFSYKKKDQDYKKYKTGKIIRGYNYSPDKYFVCEFKKKEPIKFNINRERLKILEILRKKIE